MSVTGPDAARGLIANRIITISVAGLVLISLAVIGSGVWLGQDAFKENTQLLFNSLLPLLGTWVGAVIAYYFSRENFESANKSMQESSETVRSIAAQTLERLRSISIREAMIPRGRINLLQLPSTAEPETAIGFKTVVLTSFAGPVTRLPVLDDQNRIKYIIHASMAYKFVSDQWREGGAPAEHASLATFLEHPGVRDLVTKAIAFVPVSETLAAAKTAMEGIERCQDVIVTENGQRDEAMLGWLTNVDIAKHARA